MFWYNTGLSFFDSVFYQNKIIGKTVFHEIRTTIWHTKETELNRPEPVKQPSLMRRQQTAVLPEPLVDDEDVMITNSMEELDGDTHYEIVLKEDPNCRFCGKKFMSERMRITKEIEEVFFRLTNIEVRFSFGRFYFHINLSLITVNPRWQSLKLHLWYLLQQPKLL